MFQRISLLFIFIFPATSYYIRFLFEAGISLLGLSKIKHKHVFYSCLASSLVFVLLYTPKILLGYTPESFLDVIRFFSFLVAVFFFRVSFKEIFILLKLLTVLNFSISIVLLFDSELGRILSEIFNTKSPELTFGRVAGIFHNVGVNSYYCYIACIYFYCCFLYGFRAKVSGYLAILAFVSLVIAQSKTGMILLLPSLVLLYFYIRQISIHSIFKITVITFFLLSLFFYYFETIASYFYFFTKLSSIIASGEASSLSARFDLWIEYLSLQIDSISALLFGLDKSIIASVSNTFDNDLIWILVNFGAIGIIVYFMIMLMLMRKVYNSFGMIFKICCLFTIPFSFLIGVISQPQSALIFWMFFVNVKRAN